MRFIFWLIQLVTPPKKWRLPVIVILGIIVGTGLLIIHISNAPSYLSDKPETCINCHVMYPQYATWTHSSHREVATCNDCHVPQDNFFRTYAFKAMDGMRHSSVFTMRAEPQAIRIKQAGINVVQENCIRCHLNMVDMVSIIEVTGENHFEGKGKRCWDCHRNVPHGEVRSLASTPHSLVPRLPSVMPEWLQKFTSKNNN
ncbi:MAG: cytochrome c nitrite reductase small subunit [Bacteroidales bacterium]|nr:cytochrome c nitrite reductase small subunit [Bacteroidales bacterium]